MAKHKVTPKAAPKRTSDDPGELALQLKGLASLIDAGAGNEAHMERLDTDALFFICATLEEMAERVGRL